MSLLSTLAGPVNDKSCHLKQCTLYANVLVTTINNLWGKLRKISGWTCQTLPRTVFSKVIAVPKTFSFLSNIKCLLSITFFAWYLAAVWEGQLMTSLETSTNALHSPTYWLLRLRLWKKIIHSYKNKTKKRRLGIAPLKETLPKLMIFLISKTLWR